MYNLKDEGNDVSFFKLRRIKNQYADTISHTALKSIKASNWCKGLTDKEWWNPRRWNGRREMPLEMPLDLRKTLYMEVLSKIRIL